MGAGTDDQAQRQQLAAIGYGAIGPGQLQRRDRDTVAIGRRGGFYVAPAIIGIQNATAFAGKARTRGAAHTEVVISLPDFCRPQLQAHFGSADVARLPQNRAETLVTVVTIVRDDQPSDPKPSTIGVDATVQREFG